VLKHNSILFCFDCCYSKEKKKEIEIWRFVLIVDKKLIMSNHRLSTSNVPSSSAVQIAFDSNPTPHHCGYCNTNGSCTAGLCLSSSISLRKIHPSNCGYCQVERGKFSFGKNGILGNERIFFLFIVN
jgi:hypothetical protein